MSGRLAVGLMFLSLGGCGSAEPALAPVTGRVYYQGSPLAGGMIVFAPDVERGHSGPLARATIAVDGTYRLVTAEQPGASPGWYRVAIAPPPTNLPLPRHYRNPQLSGLVRQVRSGAPNGFDFHLDDS